MSITGGSTRTNRARRVLRTGLVSLCLGGSVLAGCSSSTEPESDTPKPVESSSSATAGAITIVAGKSRRVPVDQKIDVSFANASLDSMSLRATPGGLVKNARLECAPAATDELNRECWLVNRFEPDTEYELVINAKAADGASLSADSSWRTKPLSLAQQTFPSVTPLADEVVGVGMPVIVNFDVPIADRAAIESHMHVRSEPSQEGSWHWLSDTEAHWRPAKYWQANTEVNIDLDLNAVPAGNGVYGQLSRKVKFRVGDAVINKVDARSHRLKTFINGKLANNIPITTGQPGFETRSGVKVIMEKFRTRHMSSETVGIATDSADGWDIEDVEYAMRLTYSGEFLHAAPWSVGSQGYANVSHGCTGMSTANAAWLYGVSKRGDVVEYVGTNRPMTLTNGYGDWNVSYAQWQRGSALT